MPKVLIKRGTRTQLNSARDAAGLNAGELYLVTDEDKVAVGTSSSSYADINVAMTADQSLIRATGAFSLQYDAGGPINRTNSIYHTLMAH